VPPPTDPNPPDNTEACADACAKYRSWDGVEKSDVCKAFGDDGECSEMVTCEVACAETPSFYLPPECEE
jgi:hypothetical protein